MRLIIKKVKWLHEEVFRDNRSLDKEIKINELPCENIYCNNTIDNLYAIYNEDWHNYETKINTWLCEECAWYITKRIEISWSQDYYYDLVWNYKDIIRSYNKTSKDKDKTNKTLHESILEAMERIHTDSNTGLMEDSREPVVSSSVQSDWRRLSIDEPVMAYQAVSEWEDLPTRTVNESFNRLMNG